MQLAIFDLDGTLTRTTRADADCYVRAVRESFGIHSIDSDWTKYTHSTDSGITVEVFQSHFHRLPTPDEIGRFKQQFVGLLAGTFRREPDSCREMTGVSTTLQRLKAHPQWSIALATGSWRACAVLKLRTAGLDLDRVPAAFADDSVAREEIIALARSRALASYSQSDFSRVVYVGDAPWDIRAARRLGIAFLGIAGGRKAERLLREGASEVLQDFSDFEGVLRGLNRVAVPVSAGAAL
jgi:phosphoglycolate phosphatase-like HAD superfamily hydrolase